MPDSELVSSM